MSAMPCAFCAATCSGRSRRASRPPWILGCRVFTRPSMISGNPVCSETSVTARPAWRSVWAEPPVDSSCTPRSARERASSIRPLLSETESRARRIGRSVAGIPGDSRAVGGARQLSLAAFLLQGPFDLGGVVLDRALHHQLLGAADRAGLAEIDAVRQRQFAALHAQAPAAAPGWTMR